MRILSLFALFIVACGATLEPDAELGTAGQAVLPEFDCAQWPAQDQYELQPGQTLRLSRSSCVRSYSDVCLSPTVQAGINATVVGSSGPDAIAGVCMHVWARPVRTSIALPMDGIADEVALSRSAKLHYDGGTVHVHNYTKNLSTNSIVGHKGVRLHDAATRKCSSVGNVPPCWQMVPATRPQYTLDSLLLWPAGSTSLHNVIVIHNVGWTCAGGTYPCSLSYPNIDPARITDE